MDKSVKTWFYDILTAITEIEFFLSDRGKSFSAYQSDLIFKRAIERELEIIGEAMNRAIKAEPCVIELVTEARSIVGLRNQIIHAYDNISDESIWSIVINHIPKLKKELELLLKKNDFS